jgi:hypothetical protein
VVVGHQALFAGGFLGAGTSDEESNRVDAYDAQNGTWSTASLSQARSYITSIAAGPAAIFFGGLLSQDADARYGESAAVDTYNSATGTWTAMTLPEGRSSAAATSDGGLAFFAGGDTYSRRQGNHPTAVVNIYNSLTNSWSSAGLSQARDDIAAAAVGDNVIFAGGGGERAESDAVDIYNLVTQRWSKTTLPDANSLPTAFVLGRSVFFEGDPEGVVDVLDTSNMSWSTFTESVPRNYVSVATLGNEAMLAGGLEPSGAPSAAVDIITNTAATPVFTGTVIGRAAGKASVLLTNSGDADLTGPYTVQIYAIPPGQYHNAVLVGSQAVNSTLAAGDSLRFSIPISLASAPAGTYHLVAMVKAADGNLTPFAGATQNFTIGQSASATPAVKPTAQIRPSLNAAPAAQSDAPDTWLSSADEVLR